MLTFDALAKRTALAAIIGLVLSYLIPDRAALLVAVVVLYVLLTLRLEKKMEWPPK